MHVLSLPKPPLRASTLAMALQLALGRLEARSEKVPIGSLSEGEWVSINARAETATR